MDKKRIVYIDIVRALAMLYIVGFWHLKDYLSPELNTALTFRGSSDFTNIMLGTFMFISGMLLSKYKFENLKDVASFLYKRIKRFLYLILYCSFAVFIDWNHSGCNNIFDYYFRCLFIHTSAAVYAMVHKYAL